MPPLKLPLTFTLTIDAHNKWLKILEMAQATVEEDTELQKAAAKGMRLKERCIPPEVIGRSYAKYCDLINRMYDAYLNSVHLQRAPYIQEIINVFVKRMYELRNELVHMIVNDYIYVDSALSQLKMTPMEIEIVIPYHFPLESRTDNVEQVLQNMWADAVKRKKKMEAALIPKPPPPLARESRLVQETIVYEPDEVSEDFMSPPPSIHTYVPEEYIQSLLIQKHERFRQWKTSDLKAKNLNRKIYFVDKEALVEASDLMKNRAATLIQMFYREYMKMKRERIKDVKRDILLGIVPDPFRSTAVLSEANNKVYERRRNTRLKIKQSYLKELEKENMRLIVYKTGDQIDDITDEIRNWFNEWFYGYGFFPEYPYELEGGTLLVVRGDYPTIEEKVAEDEKLQNEIKGKTKEMLKEEKAREKAEKKQKAAALKLAQQKEAINLMKSRCNPFTDPGYKIEQSAVTQELIEALRNYRVSWSIYDNLPHEKFGDTVYGYLKPLITEELMAALHKDCRKYVDELMRLDLKMLIKMHQLCYKRMGMKYPAVKARKKPKCPPLPKTLVLDEKLLKNVEVVFDLGVVTKPTTKIRDILGDSKYAAYEMNIKDPDATFPLPGYGDIKNRLVLSCVLGCGIQPGAPRKKAVMLLGPARNGKTFLADAVAGELNAVKIDITPEVFSAVLDKPGKALSQAFLLARAFQPAVVFMKNIERVFTTKVPPEDLHLQANSLKAPLIKLVKQIPTDDKVIFIATCSNPWVVAKARPMVQMFDEILLVPRADYGSVQQFFKTQLLNLTNAPKNFPVQPIAQLLQGYGFSDIIDTYNDVMTPERIVRLTIEPLSPGEFLEVFIRKDLFPLTLEEYQKYVDFYIQNSSLKTERADYERINFFRDDAYKKMEKKLMAETKAKENQ